MSCQGLPAMSDERVYSPALSKRSCAVFHGNILLCILSD